MAKIVVALGGNALGKNPQELAELAKVPASKIVNLIKANHQVVIGHGNGPQVGMIYNAFADLHKINSNSYPISFAEAGGMSQGYIGYHLVTAIKNELAKNKIDKDISYFVTQTIVDANDHGFKNPTKPVGPFYQTLQEAKKTDPNAVYINDAGRGFRKVVASPIPIDFLGIKTIKQNVDLGNVVIVAGGGGIPTIIKNNQYIGVEGVIDKDFALSKMAEFVNADILLILTAVDYVCLNFNKPNQQIIKQIKVSELEKHIINKEFGVGSMLPKIQASIKFVKAKPDNVAIIANLFKMDQAINGLSGTRITN